MEPVPVNRWSRRRPGGSAAANSNCNNNSSSNYNNSNNNSSNSNSNSNTNSNNNYSTFQEAPVLSEQHWWSAFSVTQGSDASWALRAREVFKRAGFVIILDALGAGGCDEVLQACRRIEREMLRLDPELLGCRDPGRYSFGAAARSGSLLHEPAWRHLLDCQPVLAVLDAALGKDWRFCGAGGDFVRGGSVHYQALHSDLGPQRVPLEQRVDWPPPKVAVNFTVQPIGADFGPMRILPCCKVLDRGSMPPCFPIESEASRNSKLFPLPAGAAILRDLRVWHGGTPNLTPETRFLPNVELLSPKYATYIDDDDHSFGAQTHCNACKASACVLPPKDHAGSALLCPKVYGMLSKACQDHCQAVLSARSEDIPRGIRPHYARLQQTWLKGSGKGSGKGYHK
ncbi:unnamed protein product [Polarella glacialis]|uniref:Phytanoyl-CoA dioxygenase n=1 Tax=Polarella glacialis TaxID=89957 RepID=A0A813GMF5_POLGL|nr:unnamed protein product [Polarella glacialis]